MLIYGVCISDIEKINEEKAVQFLKELEEFDYYENFLQGTSDEEDYTFSEWIDNFETNGYYGLASFLQEVISITEGINISCDDPNGIHFLGLNMDAPWNYNEKTRNMSEGEYIQILSRYISKVTDDVLEIHRWCLKDDDDYCVI